LSARSVAPVVFGLAGHAVSDDERRFFADSRPFGFILFKRNCDTPAQVRSLTDDLRSIDGCADVPILIDQEGGRVQRLQPPQWRQAPPAAVFGDLARRDGDAAAEACRINARLLAEDLRLLGVDVDCLPCLDLSFPETHAVIGDRAFASDVDTVARLGQAQADGLIAGGVLPVMKHLPGHGRATADSHHELPQVDAPRAELAASDFAPFRALRHLPMAMTAHIVFTDIDAERPATQSPVVIDEVIRRDIGFGGLLFSDDLNMNALSGTLGERARRSLDAGCDVVLHCNGDFAEMQDVAGAVGTLREAAAERWRQAAALRVVSPDSVDPDALLARLDSLCAV
jgi:beta-N-acetylhexosaminidase